jgi:hypothetical protein
MRPWAVVVSMIVASLSGISMTTNPTEYAQLRDAGFTVLPFAPGRYGTLIRRSLAGTHDSQLLVEVSTAVFVLELSADGGATACRGWRYRFTSDGPDIQTEEHFREQRGYRGTYRASGNGVDIDMTVDEGVCSESDNVGHSGTRAARIKLHCVLVRPRRSSPIPAPMMLCQWTDPGAVEVAAHLLPQLVPGEWMLLGARAGVIVKVVGRPEGAQEGDPTGLEVIAASERSELDAWEGALWKLF